MGIETAADASLAGAAGREQAQWLAGPSARNTEPAACAEGEGRNRFLARFIETSTSISWNVRHFHEKLVEDHPDRVELHVGQAGVADGRSGEAQGQARCALASNDASGDPLPGMILHIDEQTITSGFQDDDVGTI